MRAPARLRSVAPAAGGLAVGIVGGAICNALHTPLPWMIGPLFAMAIAKLAGWHLTALPATREAGQIIIATALGLYFTPTVAGEVLARWEVLVAAAVFATALAYCGAYVVSRFSDTDRTTAFFASVPGGATEMAILAERYGGKLDRVALAQSLRILMVVTVIPVALTVLGVRGSDAYQQVGTGVDLPGLAALLACAAAGGAVLHRLRAPNAFMLGALFVTIALTTSGVQWSSMPGPLSNVGQVFIGCALGARFEREFMRRSPRFVLVVCVSAVVTMALSAVFAWGLATVDALSVPTMVLATAPGGIAEMCITAKVLQLGVPLVTAAHVTRVVILVTTTGPLFRAARHAVSHARRHRAGKL